MEEIEGLSSAFKQARLVFMTTFRDGEEISRPMTNFNEDPYKMMWFPTERKSRKVEDIKKNPKVLITFPSEKADEYYEISGKAAFEDAEVTARKWKWWFLYWHPAQRKRFWFPGGGSSPDRMAICRWATMPLPSLSWSDTLPGEKVNAGRRTRPRALILPSDCAGDPSRAATSSAVCGLLIHA